MSTSADDRYSTVAKPWLNVSDASIFLTSASGIGCAGLVMLGEALEHRPGQQPILVHLARIFDEVALRPAERGIMDLGQQAMDGVAEFVEQGRRVVEA